MNLRVFICKKRWIFAKCYDTIAMYFKKEQDMNLSLTNFLSQLIQNPILFIIIKI